MKKFFLTVAILTISSFAQASILCKVNNSPRSFEISYGRSTIVPGGMFRKPQVIKPVVIMEIDSSGLRSVYSNGCETSPEVWSDDATSTVINYCGGVRHFIIYKGSSYCQNGKCAAKFDLEWVGGIGNNYFDAQCTGNLNP